MQKLFKNQRGFAHHFLIALIVVSGISGLGVWRIVSSSADTNSATKITNDVECRLLGRKWDGKNCGTKCTQGIFGKLAVSKTKTVYCKNVVATGITEDGCNRAKRVWVGFGCAKRADQQDAKDTLRCQRGYDYYNSDSKKTLDTCQSQPFADKARLLIVGDSFTDRGNFPAKYGKGWWSYLKESTGATIKTSSQGGSGYTRKGNECQGTSFTDRLGDVTSYKPTTLIIAGGFNDAKYCNNNVASKPATPKQITDGVANYFDKLVAITDAQKLPRNQIYVFTPWGPGAEDKRNLIEPIIKAQAQRVGARYITVPTVPKDLTVTDGIHPTPDGFKWLYNKFVDASGIIGRLQAQ